MVVWFHEGSNIFFFCFLDNIKRYQKLIYKNATFTGARSTRYVASYLRRGWDFCDDAGFGDVTDGHHYAHDVSRIEAVAYNATDLHPAAA